MMKFLFSRIKKDMILNALIVLVLGAILLFYPTAAAFAVRFIGIMLIYDAVSQLWNIHCLSSHARGFFK